jgi:hypothetical protein
MKKKIPLYECKVGEKDDTGIFAVSFVECPAIERNFVALNKQRPVKLALNKAKQVLTGPVLIPDMPIYRRDDELGEYYIRYTAPDIEKIAQKMMRDGLALSTTTHQHAKPLKGNYLTEIWIITDPDKDKAAALGLEELPKGTLMASYKVEDKTYWRNEVLTGKVNGFSLEGIFNFNSVNMKKETKTAAQLAKEVEAAKKKGRKSGVSAFLRSMAAYLEGETEEAAEALVDEAAKDEVDAGEPYLVFELEDGNEVWVDEEGFATMDGEQMPAGEHALADGNVIVIDDSGMLVVTQPEASEDSPEEAAAALAKKIKQAKIRGKQYLAKAGTKEAKIAALEKQIAELKKEPSTKKAEAPAEGGKAGKQPSEMTHAEKMAAVIRSRNERRKTK